MGSGVEGQRMRFDLEGDGLQSQNIQGDVSVIFCMNLSRGTQGD